MLDYTSMILKETIADVKRIGNTAKFATQGTYIVYLIYALFAGTGFWYVNTALLALAISYLVYDIHSTNHPTKNKQDKLKNKKVKRLLKRAKQLVKLFPLGIALYSLCLTAETPNIFTLLSTVFMLISWFLAFVFDIILGVIEKRYILFMEAVKADIDEVTKPFKAAGNFFKKVTGKEVTAPTPSKERALLDEQIVGYRQKRAEEKQQAKQERRTQKKNKIQEEKNKRHSAFLERKLLRSKKKATTPDLLQLPAPEDENCDNE